MNKTKIEWCDYTWNPVTGCKHGCSYCYARKIAMRFTGHFNPEFHMDRLYQPIKVKKPSKIFVCSMSDLFGDWVNASYIRSVLSVVGACEWHTFMFLTKNPKRYSKFNFPLNCQLGTTIDHKTVKNRLEFLKDKPNYKFVSLEPILSDMEDVDFSGIDLVIVGADKKNPPKPEWINSIKHHNVFYKENIKSYITRKDG